MIPLALRLTVAGGREALTRLIAIILAVAIGVALLLATLAGINAVNAQNARYAWLETGFTPESRTATQGVDPLWWQVTGDTYNGKTIARVDLAATGPHAPIPPGIPHLPGPGEFYASRAMTTLLRKTPAAQLGDRYVGRQVGTIASSALPAPDSLIIVIGRTVSDLSHTGLADRITAISTTVPSECSDCPAAIGINANGITLVLSVVALAILLPVLILITTATRLAATRREQRFAAMRLVGATPRQVSFISAVEAATATLAGVALGFPLFLAIRASLASIPFTGAPFFPSDLSLTLLDVLVVAIGLPVAAAVAAGIALRRVRISPLGVTRRATPRPPRAYRLIPLVAGILVLAYFTVVGPPRTTGGQTIAYVTGFGLILVGLICAGPWLTMTGARFTARQARRPAALLAGRRLADDPQAGFRAISGLVLALFITSASIGVITTLVASAGPSSGTAASSTLVNYFWHDSAGQHVSSVPSVPPSMINNLSAIDGVTGVTLIHQTPAARPDQPGPDGLVLCAQLTNTPALGKCPPGATVAAIDSALGNGFGRKATTDQAVWSPSPVVPAVLATLPVHVLVVGTDGSTAAVETARTQLENAVPSRFPPDTLSSMSPDSDRLLAGYKQLANVVILVSLPIAGCSLAVAAAAGLAERKRPFSVLRLTGVPLAMLRRVVALETVVPLVLTAAVSIAVGFLAAQLFLHAQLDQTLVAPGPQYYLIVAFGLVVALAILGSTFPMLSRITGPAAAPFD